MYVLTIRAAFPVLLILDWLGVEGGNPAGRRASVRGGCYFLHWWKSIQLAGHVCSVSFKKPHQSGEHDDGTLSGFVLEA